MSSRRGSLQEDVHFRVLLLLQENPKWSQRDLAAAVGISNGSAHYVLYALVAKGFVKLGNFTSSQDRRRYAYILTPKGIAERAAITRRFLARKMKEYEVHKAEIETLRNELGSDAELARHPRK